MVSYDEETIVAQATPQGSGALGIVRLTGDTAIEIATTLSQLSSKKKLSELLSHTIHTGCVIDKDGTQIDRVLFLLMRAPKTFTGQDTIEITCHNNQFIIEQIIHEAINQGARLADPGEFSKRAVLNNKIDLLQAEAINELIHAQTQMGLKQSLSQVEGTLSHWIIKIEQALLKSLTYCEVSFEFIDEEMNFDKQVKAIINDACSTIYSIKKSYNYQQQIRQGIRIAFIGSVNAGKSSLFNLLLNKQRAIVTDVAGTTRDVIEAGLHKDGNYCTFVDTAGLRETENLIEQEGIRRSMREAKLADLILLIYDCSRGLSKQEYSVYNKLIKKHNNKIILIGNKVDLGEIPSTFSSSNIVISTKTKNNIGRLEQVIAKKLTALFEKIESPFLLNQRQYKLIITIEQKLGGIKKMLRMPVQYELLAYHIKDALTFIGELTGKSISEKNMERIFRRFCVGK